MKTILFTLLTILPFTTIAQKQGNVWYFGISAGVDFSSGIPVAIFNGKTGTDLSAGSNQEGTASISDSAGHLLFYTGGGTIWNRDHHPMPNGSGIMGGQSSTHAAFIIPKPGSDSLFYLFTTEEFQHSLPQRGYRYSVLDMCLAEGKGDVISGQKNILLIDSSTEKLAACEDAGGNGYWLMGHKLFTNEFYAWHITSTGISAPVISHVGLINGFDVVHGTWNYGSAQGQMKFNTAGTKLALAFGNTDPATCELFDFNKSTGVVSNVCHIEMDPLLGKRAYGIEFSPDGTKIYAGVNGGVGGGFLYQFDLNAGDCNAMIASAIKIFDAGMPGGGGIVGMQLAPDNKIYCVTSLSYKLGCIHSPNLAGIAANFDSAAVAVSPGLNSYTLPSFIAGYRYHNGLPCDTSSAPPTPPVTPPIPPVIAPVVDSTCRLDIETKIYTDPSSHKLIINKKPTTCLVTMNIYNMIGQRMIKNKVIFDGLNEISLYNFATGIYFYEFFTSGKILLSGKILKQ